jgi:hypothetical protein
MMIKQLKTLDELSEHDQKRAMDNWSDDVFQAAATKLTEEGMAFDGSGDLVEAVCLNGRLYPSQAPMPDKLRARLSQIKAKIEYSTETLYDLTSVLDKVRELEDELINHLETPDGVPGEVG